MTHIFQTLPGVDEAVSFSEVMKLITDSNYRKSAFHGFADSLDCGPPVQAIVYLGTIMKTRLKLCYI